jgi:hypothetical protein
VFQERVRIAAAGDVKHGAFEYHREGEHGKGEQGVHDPPALPEQINHF